MTGEMKYITGVDHMTDEEAVLELAQFTFH